MSRAKTADVRAMYSKFPYPSPIVGASVSYDVANLFGILCEPAALDGKTILDGGCGTGQRVLGFASRYPKAKFKGVDMTDASLTVARSLAQKNNISNITFETHNLLELQLTETFDVIVSTGVVHHLEDPRRGLANLCKHLGPDGMICIWHYHPYGEFERLVGRELLLTMWGDDRSDLARGHRLMEQLQLNLVPQQYGHAATQKTADLSQLSINADAFMHPIVNAYRLVDAMSLFLGCGVDWVAINGINATGEMKLIDLEGREEREEIADELCVRDDELFTNPELQTEYRKLGKLQKLAVIELLRRPTGFTVMAGKGDSRERFGKRLAGNIVPLEALSNEPTPLLRVE